MDLKQIIRNGNDVIAFTTVNEAKRITNNQDLKSFYSWYSEDTMNRHLGLMASWGMKTKRDQGMFDDLLRAKQVLEVNGLDGTVTWETPIDTTDSIYTTKDLSHQTQAGIDGTPFKIVLNKELTVGMSLTYDKLNGVSAIVVSDEPVISVTEGYEHTLKVVDNDGGSWFPADMLKKGVVYEVTGHHLDGEYGTHFANFEYEGEAKTMKHRFQLGSISGVESSLTAKAGYKNVGVADTKSLNFLSEVKREFGNNDVMVIGSVVQNRAGKEIVDLSKVHIGATLEYLTMRKLQELTNTKLMFQKGGVIRSTNGVTRINEGLWHQMNRCYKIRYAKRGGINKNHLVQLSSYVYQHNQMPYEDRHLMVNAGREAYQNILEIIQDNAKNQLLNVGNTGLLGAEGQLPNRLITGANNQELEIGLARFTKAFINGVGHLTVRHDVSLDNLSGTDNRLGGASGTQGYTSFSAIITDVASQEFSNNNELPKGTSLVEGGKEGANIYLVKPEGEMFNFGSTTGRYDYRKAHDVVSSMKTLTQEFWAWSAVDILMLEPKRVVMIELAESARKGFN